MLLVCGPADAIKKKSLVFAILLPGGMDPMNAAKKIKSELVKVAYLILMEMKVTVWQILSKTLALDDFIRTIPAADSQRFLLQEEEMESTFGTYSRASFTR